MTLAESMFFVRVGLAVIAGYAGIGVLFAIWFVLRGAGRIDPVARSGSIGFRLAVLPGSAVLWPLLLMRCMRAPKPTQRPAQRPAPNPALKEDTP